ncbi:MAG TPA: phosphopantetheine-binding protein [Steroidobacteraceae bacterium]|nr:phosphopantetheine-binding protein [Steroidobacteraceae bacterium]
MESTDISARVLALLTDVAPDIDPASIVPDRNLRDQFDFDSMDTLHFATAISHEFGIDIAEQDYVQLAGLASACDYVRRMLDAKTRK